jgi:transposase-like protein
MVKTDARSYSWEAQEVIRIKAVQAVESGKTQLEVAKVFGVTRQVVGKWVKAYREGGIRALKAKKAWTQERRLTAWLASRPNLPYGHRQAAGAVAFSFPPLDS